MAILLIADLNGGQLAKDALAKALMAIADLGAVNALVTCPESAAAEAAKFSGIAYVLHAEDAGMGWPKTWPG